jgi:putative sigma-54 modulation protein
METKISSKHFELTPPIEEYINKKVDKFTRFFDRVQMVEVVIEKAKNGYALEIITDVVHHDSFVATSEHEDLYACIDLGIDRSVRQLKDHKSKLRDNKHTSSSGGREA